MFQKMLSKTSSADIKPDFHKFIEQTSILSTHLKNLPGYNMDDSDQITYEFHFWLVSETVVKYLNPMSVNISTTAAFADFTDSYWMYSGYIVKFLFNFFMT